MSGRGTQVFVEDLSQPSGEVSNTGDASTNGMQMVAENGNGRAGRNEEALLITIVAQGNRNHCAVMDLQNSLEAMKGKMRDQH